MASEYTKIFTNPYPNGWENLPSIRTPIIAQALQQHTNSIINIENYLAANDIPTRVSELINDAIPTKTSDLTNDSGFITEADIPSKTSDLTNDVGFITEADIPRDLAGYDNSNTEFVNNAVNNLLNYFLKSETYSREEVQQLIASLNNWDIRIVNELPTDNISETTIYCIRKNSGNVQLANDYAMSLDGAEAQNDSTDISVGEPIVMAEYVEDPYDD